MKIYNSLTRQKEEFKSIIPNKVGLYVCGPTVYGMPHLGHAKSYVFFDTLVRYFKYIGYEVKYVQNITDVGHLVGDGDFGEDKIQKKAKLEKIDPMEIAYKYENIYFKYMERLNVMKPSISCRATGHIAEMIDMIKILIEKGYAYVTDIGNVYFEVSKFKNYAQLSLRDTSKNETGTRINEIHDKRDYNDFALWKRNVDNHLMEWDSPWGPGFPGWHIECSAMSKKYLGNTFDIHGGGMDNMFPHHDCEIAQSEAANGQKFANYFVHNNLVTIDGKKMGKSLGNYISLDELFEKYEPDFIRFYLLSTHYRKPTNFNKEKLEETYIWYNKLQEMFKEIQHININYEKLENTDNGEYAKNLRKEMEEELSDDLNTYGVIVKLYELYNVYKKEKEDLELIKEIQKIYNEIIVEVLGITFNIEKVILSSALQENIIDNDKKEKDLINLILYVREELRNNKNFELSDKIREELKNLNIDVKDK